MAKRQFVLLAHTIEDLSDHNLNGWMMSEKYDGLRLFWDGGITRGIPAKEVPFANVERDARLVSGRGADYLATGLWSRNAKVIRAPDWFLDKLPKIFLDGEIYGGRKNWEVTSSIVKKNVPDEQDWRKIKYQVFDCPSMDIIFGDGCLETDIFTKTFNKDIRTWVSDRAMELGVTVEPSNRQFEYMLLWLKKQNIENDYVQIAEQRVLPYSTDQCNLIINQTMEEVVAGGGEGLMFRDSQSYWEPARSHSLLKLKKWYDSECTVVGYTAGALTKKGSKHLGKMGAMIVTWESKTFEISGFKDIERELWTIDASGKPLVKANEIVSNMPGKDVPIFVANPMFPRGSKVSFRYRELSATGIPKSGIYLRKAINL